MINIKKLKEELIRLDFSIKESDFQNTDHGAMYRFEFINNRFIGDIEIYANGIIHFMLVDKKIENFILNKMIISGIESEKKAYLNRILDILKIDRDENFFNDINLV